MTDKRNLHLTASPRRQNGVINYFLFLLSFHPHTPQDHNAESLSLNCLSVRWLPWLRSVLILRLCTLTAMHGAGSTNQTSIMTCRPYFFPRLSDDALMIRDSQWEDVI